MMVVVLHNHLDFRPTKIGRTRRNHKPSGLGRVAARAANPDPCGPPRGSLWSLEGGYIVANMDVLGTVERRRVWSAEEKVPLLA